MKEIKCAHCKMRSHYDKKPASLIGKIWKWHITWCPGWKSYLKALSETERKEIIKKYG